MRTYDDLEKRWGLCNGGQILVDAQHPLKMYLNVNEARHRELLIPVQKTIKNFQPTEAIDVRNYKSAGNIFFAIELLDNSLVREYVCLCFDLIESSRKAASEKEALALLISTFKKWYAIMNKVRSDILSEKELRGLMGEIKFVVDTIMAGRNPEEVINAWTIHKDAERDFIYDDVWYEIKTISSSSDYISISSLEQLNHDCDGHLVVYRLDKDDTENSVTINKLVEQLRGMISNNIETILNRVLLSKGYVNKEAYNQYTFIFSDKKMYLVNDLFPTLTRTGVPSAIKNAKYDLYIEALENWREI